MTMLGGARRRWMRFTLAATAALFATGAGAQDLVRIVLGYPPGGSNDIVARILAPKLSEEIGANVIIENKAGANGTVGVDAVAKAKPDGKTLLLISSSPLVVVPHVMKTPYDTVRDLAPISMVGFTPEAVGVHPSVNVKTLPELIELAKTKDVRLSSSGVGGLPHLTIEMLRAAAANDRIVHVPYKGGGPAVSDTLAGHVEGIVMDLSAVMPHFSTGKLRPLAVASAERNELLPDVPTAQEQGLSGFVAVNWIGVFAPAGTPQAAVSKLHQAIGKVVAQPEIQAQLRKAALVPSTTGTPAAFAEFVAKEHARWGKVARDAGLTNQ